MTHSMKERIWAFSLVILGGAVAFLAMGCASKGGPGVDACDPCEVNATADPTGGGAAAAAAASGGQKASNAPWSEDTARLNPYTTIGRGAGDTNQANQSEERRAVSSGGAQNIALMNPTAATASANSGGVSPAVLEAAKTVEAYRTALRMASLDPSTTDARLQFLADQLVKAQESLSMASASDRANITNNYHMDGNNTLVGYSKSAADGKDDVDSARALEVMDGVVKAKARLDASSSGTESSRDAAPIPERSPPPPPVPAANEGDGE